VAPPAELRRAALAVHDKQRNIGIAVALHRNGQPVFSLTAGAADLEHDVPVTAATRFGIASLTKLYTAAALLVLRQEGRVDLDAPVQRYVPAFPKRPEGAITLRMLGTHRSGIPHPIRRTPELFATHYATAIEALEVFAHDTLVAAPGTRRVYSSSNYNLLAAVIEAIVGERFPRFVQARCSTPSRSPPRVSTTSSDRCRIARNDTASMTPGRTARAIRCSSCPDGTTRSTWAAVA